MRVFSQELKREVKQGAGGLFGRGRWGEKGKGREGREWRVY